MSCLWIGIVLWGPEIVRLMTPPPFHDAAVLVPAVALVPMTRGLYFMLGTGVELSNDTRPIPLISLAALATAVVAAYLLVPWLGASGAALATFAGWVVMVSLIYTVSQKRFGIRYDWPVLRRIGGMMTVCVGMSAAMQSTTWPLRVTVAVLLSLAYPVVMYVILSRSADEGHRILALRAKLSGYCGSVAAWSSVRRT
jgi:O-antigen/teichoic acid export membrane protein